MEREPGRIVIGRPFRGTQAYVVDSHGSIVPDGTPGELWLGGEGLARCYLKYPDVTAAKFIPDGLSGQSGARLYRTGDLCRYLEDGNLEHLGRIDHQVKIRGLRIDVEEIECALSQHPAIHQIAVLLKEYLGDPRFVAYVVANGNHDADLTSELKRFAREKLPEYMVPAVFVTLDALPYTPNGKIDREALPEPDFNERETDYVAPQTKIEKALAEIWCEVLEKDRVGVQDDFFSLGGHSLLATMVLTRVYQSLKVDLPYRVFFDAPTIAELAQHVERACKETVNNMSEPANITELAKNLNELSAAERAALVMRLKKKSPEVVDEQTIPRRNDTGPVPLSFAQQRLWVLEQLGDSNYLVPATLRLVGPLDVHALERSLNEIVARHDALRTTFTPIDGQPMPVLAPRQPL